jgi:cytochrome d ubiquinol oxidase subunit II
LSSTLASFLFGVVVGNCMQGLPLGADGDLTRALRLTNLLNPYSVITGLFAVYTFAMHGSIYLYLKTEGELRERIHGWMWTTFIFFLAHYVLLSICTLAYVDRSTAKYEEYPWLWVMPVLNLLAIANIPRAIWLGKPFYAFLSSSATIAAFTFLFGATLFPNLIVSDPDPENSLTVANAASSEKTLTIMLIMAGLGLPFVLSYTATIYWLFRGKVQMGKFSY